MIPYFTQDAILATGQSMGWVHANYRIVKPSLRWERRQWAARCYSFDDLVALAVEARLSFWSRRMARKAVRLVRQHGATGYILVTESAAWVAELPPLEALQQVSAVLVLDLASIGSGVALRVGARRAAA